jgi:GNAT superfamily N-acetyltransferase
VPALPDVAFTWRGELVDAELVELTRSHGGDAVPGWWERIRAHSLGWVTARLGDGTLVGFVNVAWDGGDHAFLLDPKVRPDHQRRGIGTELVRSAARHARDAGCEWMEVDFEENLTRFYYDACGFAPTKAGLLRLGDEGPVQEPRCGRDSRRSPGGKDAGGAATWEVTVPPRTPPGGLLRRLRTCWGSWTGPYAG